MSNDMGPPNATPLIPRPIDLRDEMIYKKLDQADGILSVIEDSKRAVQELYERRRR